MASNRAIRKKWIENFGKCPLVDKNTKALNTSFAWALFYGPKNMDYPQHYPANFRDLYNTQYQHDRNTFIENTLRYLDFIGIRLSKPSVDKFLAVAPAEFHKLAKKVYFILRTIAHKRERLSLVNPFDDVQYDVEYLIRIETGQAQLSLFENMDLPQLYGRNAQIPEGYEDDVTVSMLFDEIENTNASFFITGKAGTGKSTFIRYFTQKTKKQVLLTAFTGIAAINVGGVTIHSFFNFPLRAMLPGDEEIKVFPENHQKRKIIAETDTIIIDEVSMLRADVLQAIDYSLRQNGGKPNEPFGGKQILFVGDPFQLPPVNNESGEIDQFLFREVFDSPYFFDCDAYRELNPKWFEFRESKRQKEDLEFVALLDKVRTCEADESTLTKLNRRVDPAYVPQPEDFAITLTTNNALARIENEKRLRALPFPKYDFEAHVQGDFDELKYPNQMVLELKKNAQVVFVKNDPERRWVNGTIGKIEFIADDVIEVRLGDGRVHPVFRDTWEHRGYKYDTVQRKIISEAKGTFTQYPIKLAWAITIHKSQGLTFDNVIIDLGRGAFVNGQVYTALSRCRKLNGVVLKNPIRIEDIIQDDRLISFYVQSSATQSLTQ